MAKKDNSSPSTTRSTANLEVLNLMKSLKAAASSARPSTGSTSTGTGERGRRVPRVPPPAAHRSGALKSDGATGDRGRRRRRARAPRARVLASVARTRCRGFGRARRRPRLTVVGRWSRRVRALRRPCSLEATDEIKLQAARAKYRGRRCRRRRAALAGATAFLARQTRPFWRTRAPESFLRTARLRDHRMTFPVEACTREHEVPEG